MSSEQRHARHELTALAALALLTVALVVSPITNNDIFLAVSNSGALGQSTTWRFFSIPGDPGEFSDYDTFGLDEDALYVGVNGFDSQSTSSSAAAPPHSLIRALATCTASTTSNAECPS